ncbi:hypothetical protein GGI02_005260 [Coemansia sp. RSA 2322]|nr:hypothetical protein GGI02_005260 [Coemansia sp. RSA 2322]
MGAVTSGSFFKYIVWRIINIVVAALWMAEGVLLYTERNFQAILNGNALVIIAIASITFEFWRHDIVVNSYYFMWNFMGRGICMMGLMVIRYSVLSYVAAGFSWFFGLLYIVLWFTSFTLFPVSSPSPYPPELYSS